MEKLSTLPLGPVPFPQVVSFSSEYHHKYKDETLHLKSKMTFATERHRAFCCFCLVRSSKVGMRGMAQRKDV